MADVYNVVINLTNVGEDAGPFDILYSIDGGVSFIPFLNDIPASSLTGSGYSVIGLPNDANLIKVISDGVCGDEIITPVIGYPLSNPCLPSTTTTTTTCDTSVCSTSCCVYQVVVNNMDDLAFIDCNLNNGGSQTAFSSFTFCYDQSTGFLLTPGASQTIISCDCLGFSQPTLEYSIEVGNPNIEYNFYILNGISGYIFSGYSSGGTPNLSGQTGITTTWAGNQLIINSVVSAQTNGYFIEIYNNNVLTYSASLSSFSTDEFTNNFSLNDNYFVRIFDT